MTNVKNPYETLVKLGLPCPKIPQYVSNNLKYSLFDWQKNAFERIH